MQISCSDVFGLAAGPIRLILFARAIAVVFALRFVAETKGRARKPI